MTTQKKVELELPENLLEMVDSIARKKKITRNELMEHAMRYYIEEREKRALEEEMIKGYQEMSEINLSICEEFFSSEDEVWCNK